MPEKTLMAQYLYLLACMKRNCMQSRVGKQIIEKSMLRKIETGLVRREWPESLQNSSLHRIAFIFVPGHPGVCGKERADKLAGEAGIAEGQTRDRADINTALKEETRRIDFHGNHEDHSLTRFQDMGISNGKARQERCPGKMSRLVNKHRVGIVGVHKLREELGKRSEHLWLCPECKEDDPV